MTTSTTIQAIAVAQGYAPSTIGAATFIVAGSPANPWLVTNTGDSNAAGSGSLRSAINAANAVPGSTITFVAGLSGAITLGSALPQITSGMTIQGNVAPVIAVNGAAQYRPFYINSPGVTVTMSNLTVQNGCDIPDFMGGAAIFIVAGNVVLSNCTVSGNTSLPNNIGSCISNAGTLTLTNCTVTGNTGGGIYNSGTATLTSTTLSNGMSPLGEGRGEGVYNDGTVTLTNCAILNNSDQEQGAGIYNNNSATLTNCTLTNDSSVQGGGIANYKTLTVTNCTIANCGGERGGGILNSGSAEFVDCTLTANVAQNAGGAIDNQGTVTMTNCTATGNSVGNAGPGGVIAGAAGVTLVNCIFYGDSAFVGSEIDTTGIATVTYSDIEGGYAGLGNINSDPLLSVLASNGGLTQTMALGNGSPCFGAGTPSGAPATDQRGVGRPNPPSMGAYDRSYTLTPQATANGTISPGIAQFVSYGGSKAFTEIPALPVMFLRGWIVDSSAAVGSFALPDGTIVTITGSTLTFSNVQGSHTVSATFSSVQGIASLRQHC